jgi:diaminohydroxyphosphoribosylaminopyrimidine deaminase/5-amino-6-(5-phosphoribosylamino)uracil reductase
MGCIPIFAEINYHNNLPVCPQLAIPIGYEYSRRVHGGEKIMSIAELDLWHMRLALELAANGQGYVEPNPMVGCVIARGAEIIGEGWHRRFGGLHAEIEALRLAGERAAGATMYVTLEPCAHYGKTPPCTKAISASGIRRVVVAMQDPFTQVAGAGLAELRDGGVTVVCGALESEARQLNAPYLKLLETGRPWIIAKWAMSLDGKISTAAGDSRWISNEQSRETVHKLRARMDAIIVGRETVLCDDPLLTVRPPGQRTPLRIVLDTLASLSQQSLLVRTAAEAPVLVAAGGEAPESNRRRLAEAGCEVFECPGKTHGDRLHSLLEELGRRRMTNVLVEGGARVLGSFFDARQIDEVHVFVAPKLIGGAHAKVPFAGTGIAQLSEALCLDAGLGRTGRKGTVPFSLTRKLGQSLDESQIEQIGNDVYVHGRVKK